MVCNVFDRCICLLGWDGDCYIFTFLYGYKLMVSSVVVFGVSCCMSEVLRPFFLLSYWFRIDLSKFVEIM